VVKGFLSILAWPVLLPLAVLWNGIFWLWTADVWPMRKQHEAVGVPESSWGSRIANITYWPLRGMNYLLPGLFERFSFRFVIPPRPYLVAHPAHSCELQFVQSQGVWLASVTVWPERLVFLNQAQPRCAAFLDRLPNGTVAKGDHRWNEASQTIAIKGPVRVQLATPVRQDLVSDDRFHWSVQVWAENEALTKQLYEGHPTKVNRVRSPS
jgi:hypothetical protein